MPGRRLIEESSARAQRSTRAQARRRAVLRETLEAFEREGRDHYLALAEANVARWAESRDPLPVAIAHIIGGDWGEVTLDLTRRYGAKFAVLNMANAYVPGGAYVEGAAG